MRSKTLVAFVAAATLLLGLAALVADISVARAATVPKATAPRDVRGRALPVVPGPELTGEARTNWLKGILPRIASGPLAREMALGFGMQSLAGRPLQPGRTPRTGLRYDFQTPVGTDAFGEENTPSIAASPIDERIVVAVSHNDSSGVRQCTAYISFNGGLSYDQEFDLPLFDPNTDDCADPVVRVTPPDPSGNSVFVFSYIAARPAGAPTEADVMTVVTDGLSPATTVAGPTVVVSKTLGLPQFPWIATHKFDAADGTADGYDYVYLTAQITKTSNDCAIVFSSSTDQGANWSAPVELANSVGCNPYLNGPRVAASPGQSILACYFDSGSDGLNIDAVTGGSFNISCHSSKNRGATWTTTALQPAKNALNELPRNLCPGPANSPGNLNNYHSIWQSMFPSIDIDHKGVAHLAFALDWTAPKYDAECGNINYTKSTVPNGSTPTFPAYNVWSPRVSLIAGARAQLWPSVVTQWNNTKIAPSVYISYVDHYRGDPTKPNLVYDVRYRKAVGPTFAAPVLVTSESSLSDYFTVGDYIDSTTTARTFHVIWTDRADKTSIFDYEDDVFSKPY